MTYLEIIAIIWAVSLPICVFSWWLQVKYVTVIELILFTLFAPILAVGFIFCLLANALDDYRPAIAKFLNYKIIPPRKGEEMAKTIYEQMKQHREAVLETSVKELERLADANKDRVHYLSEEAFKLGIKFAIREIEGIEMLHIKAFKELPFADPKEAEREHKNQMNTLATLKHSLIRRYKGEP